jgi:hypothetical protein
MMPGRTVSEDGDQIFTNELRKPKLRLQSSNVNIYSFGSKLDSML